MSRTWRQLIEKTVLIEPTVTQLIYKVSCILHSDAAKTAPKEHLWSAKAALPASNAASGWKLFLLLHSPEPSLSSLAGVSSGALPGFRTSTAPRTGELGTSLPGLLLV